MAIIIDWSGEAVVDCDGRFTHGALVRNTTAPSIERASVGVASLGDNILKEDISFQPNILRNLGTDPQRVKVTGRLIKPCTEGVFALIIAGTTEPGTVNPNRVSATLNGRPPEAKNADGDFEYKLEVVCCAEGVALAVVWELSHQPTPSESSPENVKKNSSKDVVSSSPDTETGRCPAPAPKTVVIKGKLDDSTVPGTDVYTLSTPAGAGCRVRTKIGPYVPKKK